MWRSKRIGVLVCTCSGMRRARKALGVHALSCHNRCRNIQKSTCPDGGRRLTKTAKIVLRELDNGIAGAGA